MRVSCFTFIRNGTKLKYPFVESIRSALPLCDEFIVAVGDSQDDTRERVLAIGDPRIRIIDTVWNSNMHRQNFVHAQQKMIAHYNCSGDWAFYIEGDEILHEDDVEIVRSTMQRHFDNPKVEALYFDYFHFNGSVEWVGASHSFYRQEVRIIRNGLRSFTSGALYFLVLEDKKRGRYPYAAASGARIFHYGNARARTAPVREDAVAHEHRRQPEIRSAQGALLGRHARAQALRRVSPGDHGRLDQGSFRA